MIPAEKIARLLKLRGWSQVELARRAKLSQRSVSYACDCKSKRDTRITTALGIAQAFGVDAEWLWTDAPWLDESGDGRREFNGAMSRGLAAAIVDELLARIGRKEHVDMNQLRVSRR